MIPETLTSAQAQRLVDLDRAWRVGADGLKTARVLYCWDPEARLYTRPPDTPLEPLPRAWWARRRVLALAGREPLDVDERHPLRPAHEWRQALRAFGGLFQVLGLGLLVIAGGWWATIYVGHPPHLALVCFWVETPWCSGIRFWQQLAGLTPYAPGLPWLGASLAGAGSVMTVLAARGTREPVQGSIDIDCSVV